MRSTVAGISFALWKGQETTSRPFSAGRSTRSSPRDKTNTPLHRREVPALINPNPPVSQPNPPLSALGIKIQRNIASGRIDPVAVFKAHVKLGDANIEIARVCLLGYRKQVQELPRLQRVAPIQEANLGALVLNWLWEYNKRWEAAVDSVAFIEELRYFSNG